MNFMYNIYIYDKLWGDVIFIRTGQEMFSGKMKFQNVTTSLFLMIFIIFAPTVGKTLSFEIMVILNWTSPMVLKYNFFRASFLHLTKDTDSI